MRAQSVVLAVHFLLAACWLPAFAQVGGDKKKDDTKKEAEKITAETKVAGKNLHEWVELIAQEDPKKFKVKDRSEFEVAMKYIMLYGPDLAMAAVPPLLGELKKHTAANPIDMSVRVNGAVALGQILANAKNRKDPKDLNRDLVKETVDELVKMLTDKQVMVRYRAAQALGTLGPLARKAIPGLCKLTKDSETWENRLAAVMALGPVSWEEKGPPSEETMTTLLATLWYKLEPAAKVRLAALAALANLQVGKYEKEKYRKRLEEMAADDVNPLCRLRANVDVWPYLTDKDNKPIALARKKHLDALEKFLTNADVETRMELIKGVVLLAPDNDKKGEPQKALVAILYKALDDKLPVVRIEALRALGYLKMADTDRGNYMAHLDQVASTDADPFVRLNAYSWLFPNLKTPQDKQKYGQGLGNLLNKSEPAMKIEACKLIGEIGQDAAATVPDLIKGLGDPEPQVVHWCIYALGNLEQAGQPALATLQKLLKTEGITADIRETAQDAINIITGKEKLGKREQQKKAEDKQ
jgi:HEAT repeat protein